MVVIQALRMFALTCAETGRKCIMNIVMMGTSLMEMGAPQVVSRKLVSDVQAVLIIGETHALNYVEMVVILATSTVMMGIL